MSEARPPAQKWALLIGIDSYPRAGQLAGAVNDAELWQDTLVTRFGFAEDHVCLLLNQAATRDEILGTLDRTIEQIGEDDVFVLFYAGHGSYMRSRSRSKPTGRDETLMPYDTGRGSHPNRDITDDEIRLRLLRLGHKTRYTTLIFDCCHSGTLHRDGFGEATRGAPGDDREPPPAEASADPGPASAHSSWLPPGDRYVVLSACRDDESAREMRASDDPGAPRHGALTLNLIRAIESRAGAGALTYRDVFATASAQVSQVYPTQHPQCEGALDRVLFGVTEIRARRYLPLLEAGAQEITLGGGAAHGVVLGSEWTLHEPATGSPAVGRVRITAVKALRSIGQVLERGADLSPLMRAVEDRRPAAARMAVEIQAPEPDRQRCAAALESSAWLTVGGEPRIRVYLVPPRDTVAPDDPVPQLGPLRTEQPVWVAVGRDGEVVMPPLESRSLEMLRRNLERLARTQELLAMDNPRGLLNGKVKVRLLRQRGAAGVGAWEPALDEDTRRDTYVEGDGVAIEAENGFGAPLYVTVLVIGIDKSIAQVYPPANALGQEFAPHASVRIGIDQGFPMRMSFPDDLSFVGEEADVGRDYVKVFISNYQIDLSLLEQGALESDETRFRGGVRPLEELLRRSGQRTRNFVRVGVTEEWAAETRELVLHRAHGIDGPVPDEQGSRSAPTIDPEYPGAAYFAPADDSNFRRWRGAAPRVIDLVVIHITDGRERIEGPIGHFQRPGIQASAHYIVGRDGTVVQLVLHADVSWHASTANTRSIGIEHVARSPRELNKSDPGMPPTDELYQASARLAKWICQRHGIPIDRDHIKGHCEAAKTTHEDCPNRVWDWDRYMALVREA